MSSDARSVGGRAVLSCLTITFLIPGLGHAQSPPDAGSPLQQIERQQPTMLPHALAPSIIEPEASKLDLTLPSGFGGTMISASPGNAPGGNQRGSTADADSRITVALVRPVTTELPGMVSVSVPEEMVLSGKAFSFPLPAELVHAAADGDLQFMQTNGSPLPSWLKCVHSNNRCSANVVPSGALPIELLASTRAQHWILMISERTSR